MTIFSCLYVRWYDANFALLISINMYCWHLTTQPHRTTNFVRAYRYLVCSSTQLIKVVCWRFTRLSLLLFCYSIFYFLEFTVLVRFSRIHFVLFCSRTAIYRRSNLIIADHTSRSAMAERPCELGNFKGRVNLRLIIRLKGYVSRQYLSIVRLGNGYTTTFFTQRNYVADFIWLELNFILKNQEIAFWVTIWET